VLLPGTSSISAAGLPGTTARGFLETENGTWGERMGDIATAAYDADDKRGPLLVGAFATRAVTPNAAGRRSEEARVLAVGDGQFFTDQYQHLRHNRAFYLNAVEWLAEREPPLIIPKRKRDSGNLLVGADKLGWLRLLTLDVLPFAVAGIGMAMWLSRRSK
jgi:hypothetical protein